MGEMSLFGYRTEVDGAATREWYAASEGWDCDCGHCRNFLALARARGLPDEVLAALDRLGVPPDKPTYVCEYGPQGGGRLYQFAYRLAGRVLDEPEERQASAGCWHETYPYGAPGFPEPNFDLEFLLPLPWVLDEPQDGPAEQS